MNQHMPLLKKCICVDLDSDFFYLLQSYAERSGGIVLSCCRADETLVRVQDERPELVFFDIDLPRGLLAWDVLARLKNNTTTRSIPVAFFSWTDQEERALEEGVDIYLQKPVTYAKFLEALAAAGLEIDSQNSRA